MLERSLATKEAREQKKVFYGFIFSLSSSFHPIIQITGLVAKTSEVNNISPEFL